MEDIEQKDVAPTEAVEAPVVEAEEEKDTREPHQSRERSERPAKRGFKKQNFKKVCLFCQEKSSIDYKEVNKLRKFIAEGGKILPRRMTGTCAKHQRLLAVAIKRARVAALIPFKAD